MSASAGPSAIACLWRPVNRSTRSTSAPRARTSVRQRSAICAWFVAPAVCTARALIDTRGETAIELREHGDRPNKAPAVDIMEALRKSIEMARKPPQPERGAVAAEPKIAKARRGKAITDQVMQECCWLKPVLVVQIEFTDWTAADHLRHSKFVALRDDKDAREVVI